MEEQELQHLQGVIWQSSTYSCSKIRKVGMHRLSDFSMDDTRLLPRAFPPSIERPSLQWNENKVGEPLQEFLGHRNAHVRLCWEGRLYPFSISLGCGFDLQTITQPQGERWHFFSEQIPTIDATLSLNSGMIMVVKEKCATLSTTMCSMQSKYSKIVWFALLHDRKCLPYE